MDRLDDLLEPLQQRHRLALRWFFDHAGTIKPWPRPLSVPGGEILLASRAKGIYKPGWSSYALSVRQVLDSPYGDKPVEPRPDGTWLYRYFQENIDPLLRDKEFTNRGLLECLRDSVPVGVMRQVSGKPRVRYQILGLARVADWDGGYFFLEGFSPSGVARERGPAGEIESLAREQLQLLVENGDFDPEDVIDGRRRTITQIIRRQGQPLFRQRLLEVYDCRCAISGCDAEAALEAAHITPYLGAETNVIQNGILLRADLHTLFDQGLIAVNDIKMTVLISPKLRTTTYREIEGRSLTLPKDPLAWPSPEALRHHRFWTGL